MKTVKRFALLLSLLFYGLLPARAQNAATKHTPVRLLIGGALELGGDEVAEVYFTNGNTQSVKAGQGGSIAVGAQLQLPAVPKLLLRATVGFKYVTTAADNVHIRLTRVPIHLTAHYRAASKFHIGGGLAMHQSIKFKADGIGDDVKFDNASGPRFEVGYGGLALTYTGMTYQDPRANRYSANAVGLSFTAVIPKW